MKATVNIALSYAVCIIALTACSQSYNYSSDGQNTQQSTSNISSSTGLNQDHSRLMIPSEYSKLFSSPFSKAELRNLYYQDQLTPAPKEAAKLVLEQIEVMYDKWYEQHIGKNGDLNMGAITVDQCKILRNKFASKLKKTSSLENCEYSFPSVDIIDPDTYIVSLRYDSMYQETYFLALYTLSTKSVKILDVPDVFRGWAAINNGYVFFSKTAIRYPALGGYYDLTKDVWKDKSNRSHNWRYTWWTDIVKNSLEVEPMEAGQKIHLGKLPKGAMPRFFATDQENTRFALLANLTMSGADVYYGYLNNGGLDKAHSVYIETNVFDGSECGFGSFDPGEGLWFSDKYLMAGGGCFPVLRHTIIDTSANVIIYTIPYGGVQWLGNEMFVQQYKY